MILDRWYWSRVFEYVWIIYCNDGWYWWVLVISIALEAPGLTGDSCLSWFWILPFVSRKVQDVNTMSVWIITMSHDVTTSAVSPKGGLVKKIHTLFNNQSSLAQKIAYVLAKPFKYGFVAFCVFWIRKFCEQNWEATQQINLKHPIQFYWILNPYKTG